MTMLVDALERGPNTTGAKSRGQIVERLDGEAVRVEVNTQVNVTVVW